MKQLFQQADRDGSNSLDINELAQLMTMMGMPVNQMILNQFFIQYDADHSGKLSFQEFCAGFHPPPQATPAPAIGGPGTDGLFVDSEFPPTADSILRSPNGPADHIQDVMAHTNNGHVNWVRASQLTGHGKLFHNVCPNDIAQGSLGDCWLLAGLAGLAEFEGAIFHIFKERALTPDGKYTCNFYDMNSKQWHEVVIDDFIPVGPDGSPCCAKPQDNEVWVLLVEKACAKWFGSYTQINGAFCLVPFMFLTACGPCKNFTQAGGNPNLYDVKQARLADAHNRNSVQLQPLG